MPQATINDRAHPTSASLPYRTGRQMRGALIVAETSCGILKHSEVYMVRSSRVSRPLCALATALLILALAGCGGLASNSSSSNSNQNGSSSQGSGQTADFSAIKHVIFLAQENRSFDHYFGKLNDYRSAAPF